MRSIVGRKILTLGLLTVALAVALAARTLAKETRVARDATSRLEHEAAAVANTISASAKALTDFPRTRNAAAVLSFYAKDYRGVENGEESSLDDERQILSDLRNRLESGTPVRIASSARNIRVQVVGEVAWATYDYVFKIAIGDEDWDEENGKCTSVLKKNGSSWLLEHEHCSSLCPDDEEEDDDEGDDPKSGAERT